MAGSKIARTTASKDYQTQLRDAIRRFLPTRGLPLITGDHRERWTPRLLVGTLLLLVWSPASTLAEAFESAREMTVAMYPTRRRPGYSLSGFLAAMGRLSDVLLPVVRRSLQRHLRRVAGRFWRWGDWVVLAVDGSRIDCPRTAANERAFGCAGRTKTGPQQMLTTIFHVATGMIWDWRTGPGTQSEREHLRRMLRHLPRRTLLLADAGFTGYALLSALQSAGHRFIVRVGSNVHLLGDLGVCEQADSQTVYLWPTASRHLPPLVLRLVRVGTRRKGVYLVTNVLDRSALPDAEVGRWYQRRWRVEVRFRSLKQTLGQRKMLSHRPQQARQELHWAVTGLAMLGLLTTDALPGNVAPHRWSAAGALRVVRRAMRNGPRRPPAGGLRRELSQARTDPYVRHRPKTARDWPNKKTDRPPGAPHLRTATRAETQQAQRLPPRTTPRC